MNEIIQIAGPTTEPVSVSDMLAELEMGTVTDATLLAQLTAKLGGYILTARQWCENYTRAAFLTQTWLLQRDGWPEIDTRYHMGGVFRSAFLLPKTPFQSIAFMRYVDTTGAMQTLTQNTDYGASPDDPIYGYQLDAGYDTRPARLMPPWARPWPPILRVANAVMVQFKCGYGGFVTASMAEGSAVLTGPMFNPGDVGQAVNVPGGLGANPLVTTILSVDGNGVATLAENATAAVALTAGIYVGQPVPASIVQAIKFMAADYYQNGIDVDRHVPIVVTSLLEMYRNRVS